MKSSAYPFIPEIRPQGGGIFWVESRSRPGEFQNVDIPEGTCSCEDFIFNHNPSCWHQQFIRDVIERIETKVGKIQQR